MPHPTVTSNTNRIQVSGATTAGENVSVTVSLNGTQVDQQGEVSPGGTINYTSPVLGSGTYTVLITWDGGAAQTQVTIPSNQNWDVTYLSGGGGG